VRWVRGFGISRTGRIVGPLLLRTDREPKKVDSGVSRRPRRDHSAAFKAKVALAALQGDKTESGTIE